MRETDKAKLTVEKGKVSVKYLGCSKMRNR